MYEPLKTLSETAQVNSTAVIILLDALDESDWGYQSNNLNMNTDFGSDFGHDEGHWRPVANFILHK